MKEIYKGPAEDFYERKNFLAFLEKMKPKYISNLKDEKGGRFIYAEGVKVNSFLTQRCGIEYIYDGLTRKVTIKIFGTSEIEKAVKKTIFHKAKNFKII